MKRKRAAERSEPAQTVLLCVSEANEQAHEWRVISLAEYAHEDAVLTSCREAIDAGRNFACIQIAQDGRILSIRATDETVAGRQFLYVGKPYAVPYLASLILAFRVGNVDARLVVDATDSPELTGV